MSSLSLSLFFFCLGFFFDSFRLFGFACIVNFNSDESAAAAIEQQPQQLQQQQKKKTKKQKRNEQEN
jgi:hypothetical protein